MAVEAPAVPPRSGTAGDGVPHYVVAARDGRRDEQLDEQDQDVEEEEGHEGVLDPAAVQDVQNPGVPAPVAVLLVHLLPHFLVRGDAERPPGLQLDPAEGGVRAAGSHGPVVSLRLRSAGGGGGDHAAGLGGGGLPPGGDRGPNIHGIRARGWGDSDLCDGRGGGGGGGTDRKVCSDTKRCRRGQALRHTKERGGGGAHWGSTRQRRYPWILGLEKSPRESSKVTTKLFPP